MRFARPNIRIIAVAAGVGLAGMGLGYLGCWPPMATVMSGSMSPTIKTGDVVLLKHLYSAPRVGDVVAVSVPDEARSRYGYPPQVIHRVVRIAPSGMLTTKGDARPQPDPFSVPVSAVDTKVVFTVPAAGRVIAFLTSTMGLVWLLAGAVLVFVMPHIERRQESERSERDALEAMRTELHEMAAELTRLRLEAARPAEPETQPEAPGPWRDPAALEPWPEPPLYAPDAEPVTHVVRRRSGGIVGRLRR
jgi:signal peptidase I